MPLEARRRQPLFLAGWKKGKQPFVSPPELRTPLASKSSAPRLSPGLCCFLGPPVPPPGAPCLASEAWEGEIRVTAAGPWAGGRQGGVGDGRGQPRRGPAGRSMKRKFTVCSKWISRPC